VWERRADTQADQAAQSSGLRLEPAPTILQRGGP
jgi:hypothetical protein